MDYKKQFHEIANQLATVTMNLELSVYGERPLDVGATLESLFRAKELLMELRKEIVDDE